MEVAEASFKIVIELIKFISKSTTRCRETSKPSRINKGALGLAENSPLRLGKELAPLNCISGNWLILPPATLLGTILTEGSKADIAAKILLELTAFSSLPEMVFVAPVKLPSGRTNTPVETTTSSICLLMFSSWITKFLSETTFTSCDL